MDEIDRKLREAATGVVQTCSIISASRGVIESDTAEAAAAIDRVLKYRELVEAAREAIRLTRCATPWLHISEFGGCVACAQPPA